MERQLTHSRKIAAAATALLLSLAGCETAPSTPDELASKLSTELYDTTNFPKGVPVPGILNGMVTLEDAHVGSTVKFENPLILNLGEGSTETERLDNVTLGIPEHTAQNKVFIQPLRLNRDNGDGVTVKYTLNDQSDAVLDNAAIYVTTVNGAPDALIAFDPSGENTFPSVQISASVEK